MLTYFVYVLCYVYEHDPINFVCQLIFHLSVLTNFNRIVTNFSTEHHSECGQFEFYSISDLYPLCY